MTSAMYLKTICTGLAAARPGTYRVQMNINPIGLPCWTVHWANYEFELGASSDVQMVSINGVPTLEQPESTEKWVFQKIRYKKCFLYTRTIADNDTGHLVTGTQEIEGDFRLIVERLISLLKIKTTS